MNNSYNKLYILIFVFFGFIYKLNSQNISNFSPLNFDVVKHYEEDKNMIAHFIVEGNEEDIFSLQEKYQYNIKYNFGNYYSVYGPLEKLLNVNQDEEKIKIHFSSNKAFTLADVMRINNNVDSIHLGEGSLISEYRGRNTIVGIIDSGVDINHPDFFDANGKTRILRIWDQNNVTSGRPILQPYGYGQEWTNLEIDSGICQHQDPANYFGHGTNVTGTAAGNGLATGTNMGVAPETNIVVVSANFSGAGFTNRIADAIHYIFSIGDSLDMPCVVNTSLGTYSGSKDGLDPPSQLINQMLDAKHGRAVVAACGNAGNANFHIEYDVENDTAFTWYNYRSNISYGVYAPSGAVFFEFYGDSINVHDLTFFTEVNRVNGTNISTAGISQGFNLVTLPLGISSDTIRNNNGERLSPVHYSKNFNEGVYRLQVIFNPDSISGYRFQFKVTGTGKGDVWASSNFVNSSDVFSGTLPSPTDFPPIVKYQSPDNNLTLVSSWTCSPKVITVGNYTNLNQYIDFNGNNRTLNLTPGEIAGNSSLGPNRLRQQKPEITASGEMVFVSGRLATLNQQISSTPDRVAPGGFHNRAGGTSTASPIVAGLVALMFERCPYATYQDALDAMTASAKRDNFTGNNLPNNLWGFGKIDGLQMLEHLTPPTPVLSTAGTQMCYNENSELFFADNMLSYHWSNGDTTPSITINDTINYYSALLKNEKGCNYQSDSIKLARSPKLNNLTAGLLPDVCITKPEFTLSAGFPTGGIYKVEGDTTNIFNPQTLGLGNKMVEYIVQDQFDCDNVDTVFILVSDVPQVSFSLPNSICAQSDSIVLNGSPLGGQYFGDGIIDNVFYSDLLNQSGYHKIVYDYVSPFGCGDVVEDSILILSSLQVNLNAPANNIFCSNHGSVTMSASPIGGKYTLNGNDINNTFNPSQLPIGQHEIRYTVIGTDGCSHHKSYFFEVQECVNDLSEEVFSSIKIWPNPVANFTNIEIISNQLSAEKLRVFNHIGQNIYDEKIDIQQGVNILQINTESWSSGIYFIQIGELGKTYKINKL